MPTWAGFYLGAAAGGAFGPSNQIAGGPGRFGPLTIGYDVGGGLVGGTIGYNFQSGPWVYGLEGDVSWVDVRGRANDTLPSAPTTVNATNEHWLGTGRARFGWTTPDNVLLYVTGGFAVASVEATVSAASGVFLSQTNTRWGGTIGTGAEAMLGRGWSAKAEYLYVTLQGSSYFPSPPPTFNSRSDVPLDQHVLRFGLDYHFANGLAAPAPIYTKAPVATPAATRPWAGFYLGAEAGGAFGNSNQIDAGPAGFGPTTHGYKISGALAGGTVGYNLQSGPWVYGLEGDLSWVDVQGKANEIAPFATTSVVATKEHWLGTGRARLGWTTPDNVLLYTTGGFAVASVEATDSVVGPAPVFMTQTNTRWGWTAGAGGEAMLGRGWSAKVEYLYVSLQSSSYFPAPPPGINIRSDVPVDEHVFRFGVNYHFGH